jgi:hypothetical protein
MNWLSRTARSAIGLAFAGSVALAADATAAPVFLDADAQAAVAAKGEERPFDAVGEEPPVGLSGNLDDPGEIRLEDNQVPRRTALARAATFSHRGTPAVPPPVEGAVLSGGDPSLDHALRGYINVSVPMGPAQPIVRERPALHASSAAGTVEFGIESMLREAALSALKLIIDPSIDERGIVSLSIGGFIEFALLLSGDRRTLLANFPELISLKLYESDDDRRAASAVGSGSAAQGSGSYSPGEGGAPGAAPLQPSEGDGSIGKVMYYLTHIREMLTEPAVLVVVIPCLMVWIFWETAKVARRKRRRRRSSSRSYMRGGMA